MPIIDIEIVLRPGESLPPGLAAELARVAGEIFGTPPGRTWVKITTIPFERYAENEVETGASPYPVFLSVLKARRPPPELLPVEVRKLTEAVAVACNRPEQNVHIVYLPDATGWVSFGGRLISD